MPQLTSGQRGHNRYTTATIWFGGTVLSTARAQIFSISSLLLGMSMLQIGSSLQGTLVAVRGVDETFSTTTISLFASGYFLGFVAGTLTTAYLIERAGHIRGFTALASLASVAALGHIILIDPIAWIGFRAISGFCFAGIYMTIESWMNERASNETRGQVLAAYMGVNLLSLTAGQFLLTTSDPSGYILFCLISVMVSLSIIPVAITRTQAPVPPKPRPLPIRRLFRISPLGFMGCLAFGFAMGAFWGLAPVFAEHTSKDTSDIAIFMALSILGGGLMQWPIGWLSDHFDRRTVLMITALSAAGACAAIVYMGLFRPEAILFAAMLFGATAFPVQALSVSHANDYVGSDERVLVSGTLLLVYGVGAVLGPLFAGFVMQQLGDIGLFYYIGAIFAFIGLYAIWRMTRRAAVPLEEQAEFTPAPATTPMVMELDPQATPDADSENSRP